MESTLMIDSRQWIKLHQTINDQDAAIKKLVAALEEVQRCLYKNKYSNYTMTDDFNAAIIIEALDDPIFNSND